ncbi:hypothetical protein SAMN05518672_10574 [Chitinophaga sp. CF118]|uniref:hypothetical protein n=1 Tax=Chitinophaga sp. CF118 TaxID=1884367 RepID=UPI0008F0B67E|nr:hypothetical protein [Chitinophaga sp. CF118]SFE25614.1 hypothetical protein SAMN05518672_10574 [Chitinophaga sp. CF118]
MINEESAYSILQLNDAATAEEIIAQYEILKGQYKRIKDETGDLKIHLEYQLKQIELDDVYIYLRRKQRI